ncbi:uncharacterized [Tachysurus ichikawai]
MSLFTSACTRTVSVLSSENTSTLTRLKKSALGPLPHTQAPRCLRLARVLMVLLRRSGTRSSSVSTNTPICMAFHGPRFGVTPNVSSLSHNVMWID